MLICRHVCVLVLTAGALLSQELRLGVQGGVPFGDFFLQGGYRGHFGVADYTSKPVGYTLGPTAELGSQYLSVAASALYQRFHYSAAGDSVTSNLTLFSAKTTGNAWSFPILLKWRPIRRSPGFVLGGPVIRHLANLQQVVDYEMFVPGVPIFRRETTSNPQDLKKKWYPGWELGGGWNFQFSKVRISPEIRYIRWTANVSDDRDLFSLRRPLQFPPNRIELLVGITYRAF
jgi:hypothetical protein